MSMLQKASWSDFIFCENSLGDGKLRGLPVITLSVLGFLTQPSRFTQSFSLIGLHKPLLLELISPLSGTMLLVLLNYLGPLEIISEDEMGLGWDIMSDYPF